MLLKMREKISHFLCIFPIDICARRRHTSQARTSIIPYPQQFVNRKIAQISKKFFSHFCTFYTNLWKVYKKLFSFCVFYQLLFTIGYGIIIVPKGESVNLKGCENQSQSDKKKLKNFSKTPWQTAKPMV